MEVLKRIVILMAVVLAFQACKKDSSSDPGTTKAIDAFLVRNNEIAGWTYTGSAWTANNVSELTTYIDGMADTYQRHGFVEAAHQDYQGSVNSQSVLLTLSVFNQGSQANATALYTDAALGFVGAIDWTNGAGNTAHYVRNGGLSQVLAFYRGGYFVSFTMSSDTEESLNVLKQFALNVDAKLKNG
jgi:hypothetical protein